MKNLKYLFATLLLVFTVIAITNTSKTLAQFTVGTTLTGFAWSDNVGWISFGSGSNTGSVTYEVKLIETPGEPTNYSLQGFAWSDNVGWIKFDPTLTGISGQGDNFGAKVIGNTITGWARACSGTIGGDCNSASRVDGYDGWIKFNNVTLTQSSVTRKDFKGYLWGSNILGWIKMDTGFFSYIDGDTGCKGVCGGSSPTPAPKCVVTSGSIQNSGAAITLTTGQQATFSVTPNAESYTYLWDNDSTNSTRTRFCINQNLTDTAVTVKNNNNVTNLQCPVINCSVNQPTPQASNVTVFTGTSASGITMKEINISQGKSGYIKTSKMLDGSIRSCRVEGNGFLGENSANINNVINRNSSTYTFETRVFDQPGKYEYTLECSYTEASGMVVLKNDTAIINVKPKSIIIET